MKKYKNNPEQVFVIESISRKAIAEWLKDEFNTAYEDKPQLDTDNFIHLLSDEECKLFCLMLCNVQDEADGEEDRVDKECEYIHKLFVKWDLITEKERASFQ